MATFPSLPLFTDALLGDTTHLDQAEFGAYMLMLIAAWRSPGCSLPNDDAYLRKITRSTSNWRRIKPVIMAFWKLGDDGALRQKRLVYEYLRAQELKRQQSEAGKSSSLKRKERLSTTVDAALRGRSNAAHNETSTERQRSFNENSTPTPHSPLPTKDPEAKASDAKAASSSPSDQAPIPLHLVRPPDHDWSKALFRDGLAYLAEQEAKPRDRMRSLIGKWLKQMADNHHALFDLLADAQLRAVASPIEWVTQAIIQRGKPQPSRFQNGASARQPELSVVEKQQWREKWGLTQVGWTADLERRIREHNLQDRWHRGA